MNYICYLKILIFITISPFVRATLVQENSSKSLSRLNPKLQKILRLDQTESLLDFNYYEPSELLNISNHVEQSVIANINLRTYFLKEQQKFDELFQKFQKAEVALASAKTQLRKAYAAAKERINILKQDWRHGIRQRRFMIHKLDTKYELAKKASNDYQSTAEDHIKRLQREATDSKIEGNDAISKISNLMQTISQLASNFIAGPMDLVNVVPLLGL